MNDDVLDDQEKPETEPPRVPPKLASMLGPANARMDRRADGQEKPIPLPWTTLAEQFGGGLWPGVHVLVSGTGAGKSAWALQLALASARQNIPVCYIGLELTQDEISWRISGEAADPPVAWHRIYTGQVTPAERARVRAAENKLATLPFHHEFARPGGWPASELVKLVHGMRHVYPESAGPGSRPMLLVLDFLQIVGDEPGGRTELRERIGRAAYEARAVASAENVAVLLVSGTSRMSYKIFTGSENEAGLGAEVRDGEIGKWTIERPDSLVGHGKESGEIEYSADTVTCAIRWPAKAHPDDDASVIFATAKGRASRASWRELRFNGHRFAEPPPGKELWLTTQLVKEMKVQGKTCKTHGTKLVCPACPVRPVETDDSDEYEDLVKS